MTIEWKPVIEEVKNSLETFFKPRGIKPTLRTMFYRLYSLQMIPNTKSAYGGLIHHLVKARKEGVVPFDAFSDGAKRSIIGGISKWESISEYLDVYHSPHPDFAPDATEEAEQMLTYIKKQCYETPSYRLGRWYNQPEYVEVWIEKDALASTFNSFLRKQDVYIAVNKGYSSWTFLYDNAMRLQEKVDDNKNIHILYFGDFDPSGDDMETGHLTNALSFFGLDEIDFHRVCVTPAQIMQYHLPEIPEAGETVEKAKRDPRYQNFLEKYGRLMLVEVDAMLALVPDEFTEIIQSSVDQYFDYDIYEETIELETENAEIMRKYLHDHIEFRED